MPVPGAKPARISRVVRESRDQMPNETPYIYRAVAHSCPRQVGLKLLCIGSYCAMRCSALRLCCHRAVVFVAWRQQKARARIAAAFMRPTSTGAREPAAHARTRSLRCDWAWECAAAAAAAAAAVVVIAAAAAAAATR